jgi:hypothetical protein
MYSLIVRDKLFFVKEGNRYFLFLKMSEHAKGKEYQFNKEDKQFLEKLGLLIEDMV